MRGAVLRTRDIAPSCSDIASGPWLWGRTVDLAVFGGSAVVALALVAAGPLLSSDGSLPTWGFLFLVVFVDVAHVWTTLFRTYLDRRELAARPALYAGVPLGVFICGAALHLASPLGFWRLLAYTAAFHFVRQQVGWTAIYRARAGERSAIDRFIDGSAIYASTLFPLLYWHARAPLAFSWFVDGDFVALPALRSVLPWLTGIWIAALGAYALRTAFHLARGHRNPGKHLVVATTAATWFVGIVVAKGDFGFTAANVIVHGAPYFALLYFYSRERARDGGGPLLGALVRGGIAVFFAVALSLAFGEEMAWDRLVWHAHPSLFGAGSEPIFSPLALSLLVSALAVPQGTHYVLDAVLWRRKDAGSAQAKALGFGPTQRAPS